MKMRDKVVLEWVPTSLGIYSYVMGQLQQNWRQAFWLSWRRLLWILAHMAESSEAHEDQRWSHSVESGSHDGRSVKRTKINVKAIPWSLAHMAESSEAYEDQR